MTKSHAYWAGKKQPAEMIEKRAAAMRGKKRKPYQPRSDESKANHAAAMAAKKDEPSIGCVKCKQMIRPIGWTRHLRKCSTFKCVIDNCIGSIRLGSLGYCGDHYAMHKAVRSKYGLTALSYLEMYRAQDGQCKACGKPGQPIGRRGRERWEVLQIDHNHDTLKVRGLLCNGCNIGLGHLGDSIDRVRAVLRYLEENDG